jgi:hypothetical protein
VPRSPCALLLALAAGVAAADPPLPPSAADLEGARALALGAYRGLAGGNDAILLNPGALAARRRYAVEIQYLQERLGASREAQWLQGSVVDSQTSSITGGFAYTRLLEGPSKGTLYHLALAAPVGGGLYAGVAGKFLDLRGPADVRTGAATADAGLYWQASRLVSLGAVGYNLVPVGNKLDAPRGMGAGLSVGDDQRVRVALDWRGDWDRRGHRTDSWLVGAETLLGETFPVRGGFSRDGTRGATFWSGGLGLVTTAGMAIDLSYRQSVQDPADRTFGAALKLQFLQ